MSFNLTIQLKDINTHEDHNYILVKVMKTKTQNLPTICILQSILHLDEHSLIQGIHWD